MPTALRLTAYCSLPTAFWFMLSFEARRGGEMADATDLKSVDRKVVWVRLPPSAPFISITYRLSSLPLHHRTELTPLRISFLFKLLRKIAS